MSAVTQAVYGAPILTFSRANSALAAIRHPRRIVRGKSISDQPCVHISGVSSDGMKMKQHGTAPVMGHDSTAMEPSSTGLPIQTSLPLSLRSFCHRFAISVQLLSPTRLPMAE